MEFTVVILALLLVALLVAVWYTLRWLRVRRLGGVSVALRWRPDHDRAGWHLGVGRYVGEEFAWYRVWSLRIGPDRVLRREGLHIAARRTPVGAESYAVPAGATVLRCESGQGTATELAMGPDALTGFMSWLESTPPGRRLRRAN